MSRTTSPSTGRSYGLARVARIWRVSRATVYRHRADAPTSAPRRPGPLGPCSDAELVAHIRQQILASRFHGEGYRKIWARLRHAGCWRHIGSGGPARTRTTAPSSPRR